ncbi:MAG: PilN domain-containing protein [Burkholderiaceae bacterium]
MIRINLLPHREMRREKRKKEFVGVAGAVAAAGVGVALAVGFGINSQIDAQNDRNNYIKAKNAELDSQIKEISNLESEIASLKARQQAVESLQSDRTVPVHLFDQLVQHTPEGVYLNRVAQNGNRVTVVGRAQTNERIADFLRNISAVSPWMERPQLVQIEAITVRGQSRDPSEERRLFEFELNALLKLPSAQAANEEKQKNNQRQSGKLAAR